MNCKEHKKRLMKDTEFRQEYDAQEPEYGLASSVIRLRLSKGWSQEELARKLQTRQSAVARLESGNALPSLSTVKRVAKALDADLEVVLRPKSSPTSGRSRLTSRAVPVTPP